MRAIRCGLVVLAVLFVASAAPAAEKAEKPNKSQELILGKWMGTDNEGKVEIVLEFFKDGTLTLAVSMGDKKEEGKGKYKLTDEKTVEVELTIKGETKKETLTVAFGKETMSLNKAGEKQIEFKRAKK